MTHPLFAGIGGHHSPKSKTNEWLTPPYILEALGGSASFDLDPCAPSHQPWPTARKVYTIKDNGLLQPWAGRVWLNPPYSTELIAQFLARMSEHDRGTALVFARTETDAFFRYIWECAHAVLFLRGRLNFHRADGVRAAKNSGAPSILAAYGAQDADRLAFCGLAGRFVPLKLARAIVVGALETSWRDALASWLTPHRGAVHVEELYRAFASHPKARSNRHWREKLRQQLQQGEYQRIARGVWQAA